MIERLIGFSIRHRWVVFMVTLVALAASLVAIKQVPLDAIPDLSDTQVIVYSRWDRSPDIIENQVTYPIVTGLLGAPGVKAIRGFSDFGFSYVYVIFNDGVDIYWARSRVLEYLSKIQASLPAGVKTEMGPDASGVGWVYQYALVDRTGKHDLAQLRTIQDWQLKYHLQSIKGVAEVASIGGFVKQYQVNIDPIKLQAYKISINAVSDALKAANEESGGRLIELSGAEYMIRSRGYIKSLNDIEETVLLTSANGSPVKIKDVGRVVLAPDIQRGVADLDGVGDTVGGTIVMRSSENAVEVIKRVKEELAHLAKSLPKGVTIETTYDRSELILRSIEHLRKTLFEEMLIVSCVIMIFLWHVPSAILPIITIPIAVFFSFLPMLGMKLTSNVMSLAGIAISIGVLVDGAIVQMENVYKRLQEWHASGNKGDDRPVVEAALKEVAPSVFFALLVIAVSFLPIFTLMDQEGRLFKPLAWSKTFVMAIAAVLVVTLNPALRMIMHGFKMGKYYPEEKHPVSRVMFRFYEPVCRWVLKRPVMTIAVAVMLVVATVPVYLRLGHEFMPRLWEGDLLYMPTTMPGISITEAKKLLQQQDNILKSFPEVDKVWGKAGRMESATDPAPLSMFETVVKLKPQDQWPVGKTPQQLISELDHAMHIPGTTNAWTMPIKNRIDMLSTGIRTPVGIKIQGDDLRVIESIGVKVEQALRQLPLTRSVFAERANGGYFLDIDIKRDRLARYGLSVNDAQMTIQAAVGGENVTTIVEGRERYGASVRYEKAWRDDPERLGEVMVQSSTGAQVPLKSIADLALRTGPGMIRNENGFLTGYVYVDVNTDDIGGYVEKAQALLDKEIKLPEGYALRFSGQYENMLRVKERLMLVVPLTIFLIVLLLYINTKSLFKTFIVCLAMPFSLIGAVWFVHALGFNMSIAVMVGMIALLGLDAETGVLMLLFLDIAYQDAVNKKQMNNKHDLQEAIIHGAVRRVRPKMMTVMAAFMGLLPIMFAHGSGSDVMQHIAAPMIGGLFTSFILELLVYPAIYLLWRKRQHQFS